MSDIYDGLHLCSVCGDRETQGDVCWVCRQQQMIDDDPGPDFVEDEDDPFSITARNRWVDEEYGLGDGCG